MRVGLHNLFVIESERAEIKKSFCVLWFVYITGELRWNLDKPLEKSRFQD